MNQSIKLKTLAAAIALLSGSQAAQAITPWQADGSVSGYSSVVSFGTPDYTIYTSGGAAQDAAIDQAVIDTLAAPGTLTIFKDAASASQAAASQGANFTGYYFIGSTNLPANLQGKKVYFEKRSRGAAGYGVVPVLAGTAIDHLNIFQSGYNTLNSSGTLNTTGWGLNSDGTYGQVISTSSHGSLVSHFSHGGFLGVDSEALLLSPSSQNYPQPVTELSTNANTTPWSAGWTTSQLGAITRIPTGGLVYGIAVTTDLYKVLQAAQIATGKLPTTQSDGTTTQGDYTHVGSLPSLSRDFIASILAGKVNKWSTVQVNVGGVATPLNSSTFTSAAGVTAPTDLAVAVAKRNAGAAVGAAAYATFLNYPYAESSVAPPNITSSLSYSTAAPVVVAATGVNNTSAVLADWQNGVNNSKLNLNNTGKFWGLAVDTATSNDAVSGANWRYVKIDGFAPTVENVASGNYPFWAEGEVTIQANGWTGDGVGPTTLPVTSDIINFLTVFANDLGQPHIGASINAGLAQPWSTTNGTPGVFATSASYTGGAPSIPFVATNPYVGLNHSASDGYTHLGIRPVNTSSTTQIELK